MGDSVINRTLDGHSKEATPAPDKAAADVKHSASERIVGFFSEDSLKANSTLPFPGPPQAPQSPPGEPAQIGRVATEPVKVGNLITISALASGAAAKPTLDDARSPLSPLEEASLAAEADEKSENKWFRAGSRPSGAQIAIAVVSIIAVAEFFLLVSRSERPQPPGAASAAGTVAIESTPPGATIAIDGQERGITPTLLSLRPGEYAMSLTLGGAVRYARLVVSGGKSSERFYFSGFDGESSSQSPSKLAPENAVLPASHETPGGKRNVPISPPAALPPTGAVGGWLNVSAPVDLQLFENGVLIGSSQADRIMLPVGRHVIEAVNKDVGYKTSMTVQVGAGGVTRVKPQMPSSTLNINAIPWAEVSIDGTRLGPTPLGDVSLTIGPHDVLFTHPQLGERHQIVVVTLNGLNRVSVNLNQR